MEIADVTTESAPILVEGIARIHALAYSHAHFSASFAPRKLQEYNLLLLQNSDISLVALEEGKPIGFVISGTAVSRGVSQFTRENRMYLVGRLLSHPKFLFAKVYGKLSGAFQKPAPSTAPYRLLSIATDPSAQSRGVGAALLAALEQRLVARGVKRYGLSVRMDNPRAVDFYRRNGFTVEKEQLGSLYYAKDLA
jgi:ribosomal protein S18 acetylase RimI-like enzyme